MIHILAVKATGYLIKNEVGKAEDKESYIYGMELIMEKVLTYLALLILALYFKLLIPSLLFVTFFVLLRGYTGGYHANTYAGCFVGTILMYLACSQVVAPLLQKNKMFLLPGLIITAIIILKLAPVNHPNLELNSIEIIKCRNGTKAMLTVELIAIIVGIIFQIKMEYITFPFLGMVMSAILLIVAKILKQEVEST